MLSKYYYYMGDSQQIRTPNIQALYSALCLQFYVDEYPKQLATCGSMGMFFEAKVNGIKKFIKTYKTFEKCGGVNLKKEAVILNNLYGDELNVDYFSVDEPHFQRFYLMMDYLDTSKRIYTLSEVEQLIRTYYPLNNIVKSDVINYGKDDFFQAAMQSFLFLQNGWLEQDVSDYCKEALVRLKQYMNMEDTLCHGDLSNVNVFEWKGRLIAIDWEDAMISYPNYDILYWLSFFDQRKYYCREVLKSLGIELEYAKDIMAAILLIKSWLSVKNGSYQNNSLTINDRLLEVVKL